MNNARRKQIEMIKIRLWEIMEVASELRSELESVRDDEQDYLDNMPEGLRCSEKGEKAEAAIEALEEAISALEEFESAEIECSLGQACL